MTLKYNGEGEEKKRQPVLFSFDSLSHSLITHRSIFLEVEEIIGMGWPVIRH